MITIKPHKERNMIFISTDKTNLTLTTGENDRLKLMAEAIDKYLRSNPYRLWGDLWGEFKQCAMAGQYWVMLRDETDKIIYCIHESELEGEIEVMQHAKNCKAYCNGQKQLAI